MQHFVYPSIAFWLYTVLQYLSSIWSNSLVFHTSEGISSSPAAFLFLIFVSTMLSSSSANCPSLMFNGLLMIFMIGSSVTIGDFPSRFLKCSFHKCIHSSWVAAFSFALAVLFLLLTSFIVCHAIRGCLSSTKSRTLLIWSWMYSVCSFRYVLVHFES